MADRQQSTTFPAPPPFFQHFTQQNVDLHKAREISQEAEGDVSPSRSARTDAERALDYLVPPEPPHDGTWRAFDVEHSLKPAEPTLQDAGIEQLFPDHPAVKLAPQAYLLSMARSLLTTFLSTTAILAKNPTLYPKQVDDLRTITINMHFLINQYRPHQARETLITLMEERLDSMRAEIEAIEKAKGRLGTCVERLQQAQEIQSHTDSEIGLAKKPLVSAVETDSQDLATLWDVLEDLPAFKNISAKDEHEIQADTP